MSERTHLWFFSSKNYFLCIYKFLLSLESALSFPSRVSAGVPSCTSVLYHALPQLRLYLRPTGELPTPGDSQPGVPGRTYDGAGWPGAAADPCPFLPDLRHRLSASSGAGGGKRGWQGASSQQCGAVYVPCQLPWGLMPGKKWSGWLLGHEGAHRRGSFPSPSVLLPASALCSVPSLPTLVFLSVPCQPACSVDCSSSPVTQPFITVYPCIHSSCHPSPTAVTPIHAASQLATIPSLTGVSACDSGYSRCLG